MKTKETIKVIEIVDSESYLIKSHDLNISSYCKYNLNGEELDNSLIKNDLVINKTDLLQKVKTSKIISLYRKGEKTISVEKYKAMPKYYDESSTEEEILRALANRKALDGFEPMYEDPKPDDLEFKIIGYIQKTGSDFINAVITGRFSSKELLYTVEGNLIAMDEYNKLSSEYSEHARFQKPDRGYLRFVQINNKYAFGDSKPFCDRDYRSSHTCLEEAKTEEEWIRNAVRKKVDDVVFRNKLTETKQLQILDNLNNIKKLKTLKSKNEMIDVLISDIQDYLGHVK